MDTVFLDANILFSAAYLPQSRIRSLWQLPGIRLMTSSYAIEEARRNLETALQRRELETLVQKMMVVEESLPAKKPALPVKLPDKDRPILQAAIANQATHLLTGDIKHFGPYYGQTVKGVQILPPAEYLQRFSA